MNRRLLSLLAATACVLASAPTFAAETAVPAQSVTNGPQAELKELITRIQGKLRGNEMTETALEPELKDFDKLIAKYRETAPDEAANLIQLKASLYEEVLKNPAKSEELTAQLKRDFPESKAVQRLKRQEESEKIAATLKVGAPFPDFNVKDLEGKPLSLANYKGKVVLIDFWATWCGPCVAELPHVQEAYEKHHANGFEIIGISLDQDREKLTSFIEKKKMTWPQFFDGQGWENDLAGKYGIRSIPATFLVDGQGKIIGKNLRGDALETAVANALKSK
jgi:peroxiredoxin